MLIVDELSREKSCMGFLEVCLDESLILLIGKKVLMSMCYLDLVFGNCLGVFGKLKIMVVWNKSVLNKIKKKRMNLSMKFLMKNICWIFFRS